MSPDTVTGHSAPHDKVSALQVAGILAAPERDPGMRRPTTIVAGSALVLLRVIAGFVVLGVIWVQWPTVWSAAAEVVGNDDLARIDGDSIRLFVVGVGAVLTAAEAIIAFFIWRGSNLARVLVMILSVISVVSAFAAWWARDQELTLQSSLLPLTLDVLILLALSSRSAAAYARRNERR